MGGAWLSVIQYGTQTIKWVGHNGPWSNCRIASCECGLVPRRSEKWERSAWYPWFSGELGTVHVAQPYIIESQVSIGTRLATVQVWNVKLSQSSTVYSKYSFTISVHISRVDTISNQISKSVLFTFFKWGNTGLYGHEYSSAQCIHSYASPFYVDKIGGGSLTLNWGSSCTLRAKRKFAHNTLCSFVSSLLSHCQDCTALDIFHLCGCEYAVCQLSS